MTAVAPCTLAPAARVLVTTPAPSRPGGVAQYLRTLRPYLGENVQYLTVGSRRERESLLETARRLLDDSWSFLRALKDHDYDVVHLNPSLSPKALFRDGLLLLLAKSLGRAVVVFLHGWDQTFWPALSTRWRRLFRGVYGMADAFIVLGRPFKAHLETLGWRESVFVQGAPIDDELFTDAQRHPAAPYAGGPFRILFLARLDARKGIYEALQTYKLLKQKYPLVTLTVAGDGPEREGAIRCAEALELTDISFPGHVQAGAKHEIYEQAHAYLFPSHTEGLPISVLEAMAYGIPVVTTAVGGLPDFFLNGAMGFISESRNPEVLSGLLERLIGDPALCSKIALFNRIYAREHFTPGRLAATLERVYGFVLEGAD
jgi:glycosyltransferase involved in cell wall biosynthesis